MSKRRVLGAIEPPPDAKPIKTETLREQSILPDQNKQLHEFICPICNAPMNSLLKLNNHIDAAHLEKVAASTQDKPTVAKKSNSANRLTTEHWIKPVSGAICQDRRCNKRVGLKHGIQNCAKCGKLYCSQHCKIPLKLNTNLEIVNETDSGIWSKCCLSCLESYSGWNNIGNGAFVDVTNNFKKLRKLKLEKESLHNLVIERRLEKVFNTIVTLITENGKITESDVKNLEFSLVDWVPGKTVHNCSICEAAFGLFKRKHHCRICGNVVCGDISTGCSMLVPLGVIFTLMKSEKALDSNSHDYSEIENILKKDIYGLRICLDCKNCVLSKRVFEADKLKLQNSEFMNLYRLWKLLHAKIESEDLSTIKDDDENMMYVSLFARLDKLAKKVDDISENNHSFLLRDEIRMLKTLKTIIVNYIQEKLPILRRSQEEKLNREREILQQLINDKPKLTKLEIRQKREKLMVLNEQKFLVENMYQDFKKQRRFDDLRTLDINLADIEKEIAELETELGENSFNV